jgi:TRL-like protein family
LQVVGLVAFERVLGILGCGLRGAQGRRGGKSGPREKGEAMLKSLVLALSCAALIAGCALGHGPVLAPVTFSMKGPVAAGPATTSPKMGRAEAWGIVLFATGDASISAAASNGGITKIHHVDHETMNILGIYAKYTTIVYGE